MHEIFDDECICTIMHAGQPVYVMVWLEASVVFRV